MATYTSHYNLKKPATTDNVDIADFNGNFDLIDAGMYTAKQQGDAAKGMIESSVESSSTAAHAYAEGEYFIYLLRLYRATSAIAVGDTITPNTNCVAVTVGGELVTLRAASVPSGGTQGQVLTKTSNGIAWQDPQGGLPAYDNSDAGYVLTVNGIGDAVEWAQGGLPSGGTVGQILTLTNNGAEWRDPPSGLPTPQIDDEGKVLMVVASCGELNWGIESLP